MLQLKKPAVILRSRKLFITGVALILIALLTIGIASLYVWLAPRTYSAQVLLSIQSASPNGAPVRAQDLPLESFKDDRNLRIENPRNSSLFRIVAFASTPDEAVVHANKSARELEANVRSLLKANVSLLEPATANPRPVRPNRKAILTISGVTALNIAFVGSVLFLTALLRRRRVSGTQSAPDQVAA